MRNLNIYLLTAFISLSFFTESLSACTAEISPSGSITICQGSSIILSASPVAVGNSYSWYRNGILIPGATSTLVAKKNGAYTVKITDAFGCVSTSTPTNIFVEAKPAANITFAGNLNICPETEFETLNANSGLGYTYQWIKNGVNIVGANATSYDVTTAGSYRVRVTNAIGCSRTSAPVSITEGCSIPCSNLPEEYSEGLVAFYPFCGNGNDVSGALGNSAVFNNAVPSSDRFGNPSSAYYFNGFDTYMIANANNFPTTSRTVVFYFKLDDLIQHHGILGWGGNSCGQSFFISMNQTDLPNQYIAEGHCLVNLTSTSNSYPPSLDWHQFAITTGDGSTQMYLDGILINNFEGVDHDGTYNLGKDFVIGAVPAPLGSGAYTDVNLQMFKGYLDDVIIYDRVLTSEEVLALYNYFSIGEREQNEIELELSSNRELVVYPNPVNLHNDNLNFDIQGMDLDGITGCLIMNNLGQVVYARQDDIPITNGSFTLSNINLSAGIYQIEIKVTNEIFNTSFVVIE